MTGGVLIVFGLLALAALAVFVGFRIKRSGRIEAEGRADRRAAEHAREAHEIDESVACLSDADRRRERLRWSRSE